MAWLLFRSRTRRSLIDTCVETDAVALNAGRRGRATTR